MNRASAKSLPAEIDEKRARILDAARTLFLRYGFSRTTIGDIAHKAGISRPGVYLQFASKNEILAALIETLHEEMERLGAIGAPLPTSLSNRVAMILDTQICVVERMTIGIAGMRASPETRWRGAGEIVRAHLERVEDVLAKILESEGLGNGAAVQMFLAAAYGVLRAGELGPDTARDRLKEHVDTLLAGLMSKHSPDSPIQPAYVNG